MKNILFLQGGGVIHDQYEPFLEQFRNDFVITSYDYPTVKSNSVTTYSAFINSKLKADGIKPDVIIGHSLGAAIALEMLNDNYPGTKTVLISPLISSISISRLRFGFNAVLHSNSVPRFSQFPKYILNIRVFLSQLMHLNKLNISTSKEILRSNQNISAIITAQDKLIPEADQKKLINNYSNIDVVHVSGDHGWIINNRESANIVMKKYKNINS